MITSNSILDQSSSLYPTSTSRLSVVRSGCECRMYLIQMAVITSRGTKAWWMYHDFDECNISVGRRRI
jgi:hypothetical protein